MWNLDASNRHVAETAERVRWAPVAVHPECDMLRLAACYDVPPLAVAMAATYVQRIAEAQRQEWALMERGWLVAGDGRVLLRARAADTDLMRTYAACVVIATKLVDRCEFYRQLSHMLRDIDGGDRLPSKQEATDLELSCLEALGWRLGLRCGPVPQDPPPQGSPLDTPQGSPLGTPQGSPLDSPLDTPQGSPLDAGM